MADAVELWKDACRDLQSLLHPDVYGRWIAVIRPAGMEGDTLTVHVDNNFYQSWLEDNYVPLITEALSRAAGRPVNVRIEVSACEQAAPAQEAETGAALSAEAPKPRQARERHSRFGRQEPILDPRYTFATFVIGPSNSFAHAASLAVAQAPARAYNPLFIYGGTGLGKTHLMQAIGHHVLATSRSVVCYINSETLLNEYIDALQKGSVVSFRKKYRSADLLLIDDIHFLAGKKQLQEEFFHTFNALFDAHKQIVMTSDRPAAEIANLEERLVSRFEWGLVTELEPPDLETRIAILRSKLAQAKGTLKDEIILFIAEKIRSNVRRLEGALIRTLSYSSLTGQPMTIESLSNLLRDLLEEESKEEVTFEAIQRAVAEHYDVRLADMTSKRRPRSVALPRQVAMYLCRRLTRSSLPDIANAFGKTHATVLHACRSIQDRMDVDANLRKGVTSIAEKLGRSL